MLGKLLKYEVKATARIFLPLYGLVLVLAVINRIFLPLNAEFFNIPRVISMTVYVMLIVAVFVMTLVVTIQRFYKNLLGDEGYLSFTLPVKAHSHIDTKMVVTLMWAALSLLVSGASVVIIAADANLLTRFSEFCRGVAELYSLYGLHAHLIVFEILVLCILGFLTSVLQIYASISVGNLAGRHKLLAGFGAYIGFGVVMQILSSILVNAFGETIAAYFRSFSYSSAYYPPAPVEIALLGIFLYTAVFFTAFYFLTNWMLSRKLNLE